jgi:UPF0755 protein
MKKLLICTFLALIILGAFGISSALKARDAAREQRLKAKAPQTSITLLEGWGNQDIADYLEKNGIASSTTFLADAKNFDSSNYQDLASKPKTQDLEGFLFPDTYFIPETPPVGQSISNVIIKKLLDNFTAKITPEMLAQAEKDNMSLYQIVTLASIIEKESGGNQDDRKTIAGVFYNRLKAGMPLESDATVLFINNKATVSPDDLNINSPYNTYKYPGLPPGPICNPGLNSIMAALYPTPSDDFYFLTIPQTGRAVFAKTYDEHLKNVAEYLK